MLTQVNEWMFKKATHRSLRRLKNGKIADLCYVLHRITKVDTVYNKIQGKDLHLHQELSFIIIDFSIFLVEKVIFLFM